jgi:RNA polymerase sigma factor (sigma-70 family)
VIERFHGELLNFLTRRVGNRDLAADLTQESFARVYSVAGARPVMEPRALLYTTARNLLTDHHRRSTVRGAVAFDPVDPERDEHAGPDTHQPEVILDGRQRLQRLEQTLAALPPRAREAFVLAKIDGLSRAEVAQTMGVSVKTVESHLEVAMRACAQALPGRASSRRHAITSMLTVGGLACLGGWVGWAHWRAQPLYQQAFSTRRGQQQRLMLPDGSQLRLDTATRIEVAFHRSHRHVRLLQGQAFFDVAPDSARPFHVRADTVNVTVVGTRFSVRLTPEVPGRAGVEVAVEHGRVRVAAGGGVAAPWQPLLLEADQRAVFDTAGRLRSVERLPPGGAAPWRERLLSVDNRPLAQALAELERYAPQGIASVDPAVAGLRLSGTFDPHDATTTRRLLTAALPLRLVPGPTGMHLKPAH